MQRGEHVGTSKTSGCSLSEDVSTAFALARLSKPIFLVLVHRRHLSLQGLVHSLSEWALLAGAGPSGSSNINLWQGKSARSTSCDDVLPL